MAQSSNPVGASRRRLLHTARLAGRRRWFLGASTEWPGVLPADVEIGKLDDLALEYPSAAADVRAIANSARALN